ncbi:MAG: CBS domain-containing protein [Bacteroidia bacterium]|nr:CBS domain-containing protein [Bacteroidia bacterium]
MLAGDLITDEIPPLKTTDTVEMALDWMEQFKVSHLAVVNNRELVGLVSETDLLDYEHPEQEISASKLHLMRPAIHHYQHTYDLLRLMSSLNLTLIPVIDEKELYKGCITLQGIVQNLSNMASVQNPGGVIVLEMNQHDYSVTHIGNIIEGNEAKILSLHVSSQPDSTKIEVTIKVNRENLSPIIQTFNRYNYSVKATFQQGDYNKGLDDRLNEFMHFLNI